MSQHGVNVQSETRTIDRHKVGSEDDNVRAIEIEILNGLDRGDAKKNQSTSTR
jgi:hypothetical protein